jgi:hypothetical protein
METRQQAELGRGFGETSSYGRGAGGPARGGTEIGGGSNVSGGPDTSEMQSGDEHLWAWWRLTHRIRLGRFSTGGNRDESPRREIS